MSMQRLLSWTSTFGEVPAVLLLYDGAVLWGVALLAFRRLHGIPLGFATGGNIAGQGSVISQEGDRIAVLEEAARVLLRGLRANIVKLSTLLPSPMQQPGQVASSVTTPELILATRGLAGHWRIREVRLRISLEGGMPAVMARLSYKMRRNIRYYRRRAETDCGLVFVPEMTLAQRKQAVAALHSQGTYPMATRHASRREAGLHDMPKAFAMGLQDRWGTWVSYVAGWRAPDGSYVDWQLNADQQEAASISTVMRAYLLEHEASRGSPAIVFAGMTAPFWGRACEPALCGDLIATRAGPASKVLRALAVWVSPHGQVAALLGQSSAETSAPALSGTGGG